MRPAMEMPFEQSTRKNENSENCRFNRDRADFSGRDRLRQALAHKVDAAKERFVDALRGAH